MAGGSRSREGCLTCRIRKKKCDEQHPVCRACYSRQLTCYGYSSPLPSWYTDKATWKEVQNCEEAKSLRAIAETRYKIHRKTGWKDAREPKALSTFSGGMEGNTGLHHTQSAYSPLHLARKMHSFSASTSLLHRAVVGPNTWQLHPGTIWWESRMNNLETAPGAFVGQDTRLLMVFLDVIHPITHTFYRLNSSRDRNWLLSYILGDRALHFAALSVSACFEHSLTQRPMINNIGICSKVRSLQSMAVSELGPRIGRFATVEDLSPEDFVCNGMQLLDVVIQLLNLEIFSMLQGAWEMHYRAARVLVNSVETRSLSQSNKMVGPKVGSIEYVLSILPPDSERYRSLEFCLTNFVWIDVIATATFGLAAYIPIALDYHHLLYTEQIKTQYIMGCQSWVMSAIGEIAKLEQWKMIREVQAQTNRQVELMRRHNDILMNLKSGIERLEKSKKCLTTSADSALEEDVRLVTIIWGYAAQVFLQFTTYGMSEVETYIDQATVSKCLEKLEELPTRLVMRIHWPYTIAGCMATCSSQQAKFRGIFGRTMQECQSPGVTWKGLMIMEECWRIRQIRGDPRVGWREAMESLGARVLLM